MINYPFSIKRVDENFISAISVSNAGNGMVISDLRGSATQQVVTQKFTCPAQEGEAALSAPAAAENFVTICRLNLTDIAEIARQRLRSPFKTVALIRTRLLTRGSQVPVLILDIIRSIAQKKHLLKRDLTLLWVATKSCCENLTIGSHYFELPSPTTK